MSILVKNGRVVTAAETYVADVFIEGEQISAIGKDLNYAADKIIDATDKLVFPGGIDPHVHLDMPFMGTYSSDDYETELEQRYMVERQWLSILYCKHKEIHFIMP